VVWYEARARDFFGLQRIQTSLRAHVPLPPIQQILGAYQPEHEAHSIPHSSTEVKNEWSYYSTSPYNFMACTGVTLLLMVTEL
jgi:hypothetical protein